MSNYKEIINKTNYKNSADGSEKDDTDYKSTINNTIIGSSYSCSKPTNEIKGSVVVCVHGLLGTKDSIDPLFDTLNNSILKSTFDSVIINKTIISETVGTSVAKDENGEIEDTIDAENLYSTAVLSTLNILASNDKTKNYFIKVVLKHSKYGNISTQVESLHNVIATIKNMSSTANLPIILLGYSKGGVINMRYSLEHPNMVEKLISIGTPYTNTIVQQLIGILCRYVKNKMPDMLFFDNILKGAIDFLSASSGANWTIVQDLFVTDSRLNDDWNDSNNNPKLTVIAGTAFSIDGSETDLAVPNYSALALGFKNITCSFNMNKNINHVNIDDFLDYLGKEAVKGFVVAIKKSVEAIINNFAERENKFDELIIYFTRKISDFINWSKKELFLDNAHMSLPLINNNFILNNNEIDKFVFYGLYA